MILGATCTRSCSFCGVRSSTAGEPIEEDEGERIVIAARRLDLAHIVLTSVTRDDLPDGGASHFAGCIRQIKAGLPDASVEVLIPDLQGDDLEAVLHESPDVLGHNVEVVKALQGRARDRRASYETSLGVLRSSKRSRPDIITKSSLMLGLGEGQKDVLDTMQDLVDTGVDILTIGQYLKPSQGKAAVKRYVPPQEFDFYKERGDGMGFAVVISGPFVRSSYKAAEAYGQAKAAVSEASAQSHTTSPPKM